MTAYSPLWRRTIRVTYCGQSSVLRPIRDHKARPLYPAGIGDAEKKIAAGAEIRLTEIPIGAKKDRMSKSKKSTVSDVLRKAIAESGLTLYRIAKDTGVVKSSLLRFMAGETSLRLDRADVLAEHLAIRHRFAALLDFSVASC